MSQISKYYTWVLKGFIFIIPFLSLYISRSMFFPFITGRNFTFRILVEIGFVLWLGLIVLNKKYRPQLTPLLWALIAFMAIVGLADFFGTDPFNSFWSRYERMEGYILLLHMFAYFLMVTSVLRTKKDWIILFNIFVAAGLIVGGFAVMQRLGLFKAVQGGRLRVDGTIGNPTYLASYLLFILGLILYLFSFVKKKWTKWYYGTSAAFILLIIYFTASRGPTLALGVVAVLFPVLYLFFGRARDEEKKLHTKIAAGFLIAMFLAPTGFWLLKDTQFIQKNPTFSRFANISLTDKTTRSRFDIWGMGIEGFKERPILGWGQENYLEVFGRKYNPDLFDQEPWFDRAHNIVVDWLVNAGILGLISYLSLFGMAFWMLWKGFKNNKLTFNETGLLTVTLIAYFLQNLFVFDNFNTYLLFFSILGFIHQTDHFEENNDSKQEEVATQTQNRYFVVTGISIVLIGTSLYFANIKPIQESRALITALISASQGGDVEMVKNNFEKALNYQTFGDNEASEQFLRSANNLTGIDVDPARKKAFIESALGAAERQVAAHPNDIRPRLSLSAVYNRAAFIEPSYKEKALGHIMKVIEISPTRQTAYYTLADNHLLVSNFEGALGALEKAVELAPHNIEAQVNLGRVALLSRNNNKAEEVLEAIESFKSEVNPNNIQNLAIFADGYINQQKFSEALRLYELILPFAVGRRESSFSEGQLNANAASLYLSQGNREKARTHALKAKELDPALTEAVDSFLQGF